MIRKPQRGRSTVEDWIIFGAHSPGKAGLLLFFFLVTTPLLRALPIGEDRYVDSVYHSSDFCVVTRNPPATLLVESTDFPGVVRASSALPAYLERVTTRTATVTHDINGSPRIVI